MSRPTVETLTRSLDYARKQRAFAWAKFYDQVNIAHLEAHMNYMAYLRVLDASDTAIPIHIINEFKEMSAALKKKWECPICLDMISEGDLDISNCGHYYCKPCLQQLIKTQKDEGKPKWECGVCRKKHTYKSD
jgi:hypothetical protein